MTGEGDMAKYIASRFKKRPAEDSDRGGGAQFNRSCKSTRKWANGAIFFSQFYTAETQSIQKLWV